MRWARNVDRTEKMQNTTKVQSENVKETDHLSDLGLDV